MLLLTDKWSLPPPSRPPVWPLDAALQVRLTVLHRLFLEGLGATAPRGHGGRVLRPPHTHQTAQCGARAAQSAQQPVRPLDATLEALGAGPRGGHAGRVPRTTTTARVYRQGAHAALSVT